MQHSSVHFIWLIASVFLGVSLGSAAAQEKPASSRNASSAGPACPPHRGSDLPRPNGRDMTPAEKTTFLETLRKSPTGRTIVDQFSIPMTQAAAKRQNTTRHSHDTSHGNQISFSTADGQTYLWYPGNPVVLKGEWRACEDRFGMTVKGAETMMLPFGKICVKFGPNTFNPATGSKGNEWECAAASKFDATLVEQRQGDVFGLAKRTAVPFVLAREKTTMNQLLTQMPKGR